MWASLSYTVDEFSVYEFELLGIWKAGINQLMCFFSGPHLAANRELGSSYLKSAHLP